MKKLLVSILAVAALAACTKSDVIYDEPSEITVSPVSGNITKAMMTGTDFETSQNFNVWAWYKQVDAGTSIATWQGATTKVQQEYIIGSPFKYKNGLWGGVTPYYWPKQGSLLFAGYYPTSIADNVKYNFNATTNKMVFSNITPDKVVASSNPEQFNEDIMYFNMTPVSVAGNNVEVTFKHALSWITVNVAKTTESPKIVINEIKFTDVYASGNGVVDNQSVIEWTPITKNDNNATINPVEKLIASNQELSTTSTKLAVEPLFIPQVMTGKLYISYTIYASNDEHFTEVYELSLKSTTDTPNKWEPGKHYIYNVTIGTTEILIDPSVVNWVDEKIEVTVD